MNPRSTRHRMWLLAALPAALAVFPACSSGSSGGGGGGPAVLLETEPNDLFDDADVTELTMGRPGCGVLASETDIDFWSLDLTEGQVVRVELFGTRIDQSAWDLGDSIPRVTIYAPDGATVLVNHDYTNLWNWGKHDLDHPMLLVPADGTYYASVTVDGASVVDGDYCLRVDTVNVGSLQLEIGDDALLGNDVFGDAEPIVPGTVYGFHDDDDSDYFSFEVNSPSVVRFELTSYRNGVIAGDDDYYDTWLTLYDTDGTTALYSDDDTYFYDSAIAFLIDTPGTYFIEVTECCGSGDAPYFLTYSRSNAGGGNENEPNENVDTADAIGYGGSMSGLAEVGDVDGFRFNATRGDMVRVQLFDSTNSQNKADFAFAVIYGPDAITTLETGGDEDLRVMTTIIQETGPHYIVVETGGVDTEYRVELTRFKTATYESEPNNDTSTADALPGHGRAAGVIEGVALGGGGPIDVDTFRFNATADRLTTISVYASSGSTSSDGQEDFSDHGSDLSPTVRILDSEGAEVAISFSDWLTVDSEDVVNSLPCAAVSFVAAESGTYYVEITDSFDGASSDYYYVIEKTN